jgi:hypothetical protein
MRSDYLQCCQTNMQILNVKILSTGMILELRCRKCEKRSEIKITCEFDMTRNKIRIGRYSVKYTRIM